MRILVTTVAIHAKGATVNTGALCLIFSEWERFCPSARYIGEFEVGIMVCLFSSGARQVTTIIS